MSLYDNPEMGREKVGTSPNKVLKCTLTGASKTMYLTLEEKSQINGGHSLTNNEVSLLLFHGNTFL